MCRFEDWSESNRSSLFYHRYVSRDDRPDAHNIGLESTSDPTLHPLNIRHPRPQRRHKPSRILLIPYTRSVSRRRRSSSMAAPPCRLRLRSAPLGLPTLLRGVPRILRAPPRLQEQCLYLCHRHHGLRNLLPGRSVGDATDSPLGQVSHTHDPRRVAALHPRSCGGELCEYVG
jgi:hypothetical protein